MINLSAIVLMLLGLFSLLTTKHIIKIIVALNIFEVGLNLFIITIGYKADGLAPILTSENSTSILNFVDPLPQAIVLTAIVIGFGLTSVGLMLAKKMYEKYGTYNIDEIGGKL